MLHIDSFDADRFQALAARRGEALSIYMPAEPESIHVNENRIRFKTLAKSALEQAKADGFSSLPALEDAIRQLDDDYDFWSNQAHGLAVLAVDGDLAAIRLAYQVAEGVNVGEKLHISPLLPALQPKLMWVLMVSDEGAELYQLLANRTLEKVDVPGMPEGLREHMGELIERRRGEAKRLTSGEGYDVRQQQFLRAVHDAISPLIRDSGLPLVMVATVEHFGEYKALNTYPLLADNIARSPTDTPHHDILAALDAIEQSERQKRAERWVSLYSEREGQRRATSDVEEIARLVEAGQVETLMVAQEDLPARGSAPVRSGRGSDSHDAILRRAVASGADIIALRADETVAEARMPMAATLRWAR